MTHPTPTIGVAAIAAAALIVPAVAQAHTATVACNPATGGIVVTPDYQQLNPTWTVTAGRVEVTWSDGYRRFLDLPGPCEAPAPSPAPAPAPAPAPPGEATPPPPAAVTCADLLAAYPKAGRGRRAAWGCPATPITKPPAPRPRPRPRVVTCAFVVAHYSGAARTRMVTRYGLPATCGRPFNPPVAG